MSKFVNNYNGDIMKKIFLSIIIIFILGFLIKNSSNDSKTVMEYNDDYNINSIYYLDFSNEILSTNNFKLKIAPFTGYNYVIRRIYPKYNSDLKKYYIYDFDNIDLGVQNFKDDYISYLRSEKLYDEVDKVLRTGIVIKGIEIYTSKEALKKFNKKYPKVKYKILNENYNQM